jgi:hypothetical protein
VSERERAASKMGLPWAPRGCYTIKKSLVKSSRDNVISIITSLRIGRSGVRIPIGARACSVLQIVQTRNGSHSASYSKVWGVKRPENKTNNSLPPRLEVRTNGPIFHSHLYACMACIGTTLGGRNSAGSVATR